MKPLREPPAITLADLEGVILDSLETGTPAILLGPPGVGKTEATLSIARRLGVGAVLLNGTALMAADLVGLPVALHQSAKTGADGAGVMTFSVPTWLADIRQTGCDSGILILDEMAASHEAAPAFAQLLGERRCGPHRLPDGWVVIGTGNRPGADNAGSRPLYSHIVNRAAVYTVKPDKAAWLKWARSPAATSPVGGFQLPAPLVAYVAASEFDRWLERMGPEGPNAPWLSFRSLSRAGWRWAARSARDTGGSLLLGAKAETLLTAHLPPEVAAEILEFALAGAQLPAWEDILGDPEGAPVPSIPRAWLVLGEWLVQRAPQEKGSNAALGPKVRAFARYLSRCPGSIAATVAEALINASLDLPDMGLGTLVGHPEFSGLVGRFIRGRAV